MVLMLMRAHISSYIILHCMLMDNKFGIGPHLQKKKQIQNNTTYE